MCACKAGRGGEQSEEKVIMDWRKIGKECFLIALIMFFPFCAIKPVVAEEDRRAAH